MRESAVKEYKTTVNNVEHIIIDNDHQVIVRKYNTKSKMWIEFVYDKSKVYADDTALIELLKYEYIKQKKSPHN
ncbi:hypothetical protein [Paenibacillus oceani]|uniref:Uncharacterized protein n=1 Tax=Paenibacillus oceani TaxID=2772510 RepID=A0A927CBC7_9BACL|nr:hypothetical protein [Paenibacillus oceani]MBD2863136.1 hypothetical protein [Paenibacillus oceani]